MTVKGLCGESPARSVFSLALASREGGEERESRDGGVRAEKSLRKPSDDNAMSRHGGTGRRRGRIRDQLDTGSETEFSSQSSGKNTRESAGSGDWGEEDEAFWFIADSSGSLSNIEKDSEKIFSVLVCVDSRLWTPSAQEGHRGIHFVQSSHKISFSYGDVSQSPPSFSHHHDNPRGPTNRDTLPRSKMGGPREVLPSLRMMSSP